MQIQSRNTVPDHTHDTAPSQRHELDKKNQEYVVSERSMAFRGEDQ